MEGLQLLILTTANTCLIIFAIIIKYVIFGFTMTRESLIKKGSSYRTDDLIAIFYVFFAYTLILFFKNGLFIKTILGLSYFVWWTIFLIKRQITTQVILSFVYCIAVVYILSETIIPNYGDNSLTTELFTQKIILVEFLMTLMIYAGIPFVLDIKDKISFFINIILVTVIIYISCALTVFLVYCYYAV